MSKQVPVELAKQIALSSTDQCIEAVEQLAKAGARHVSFREIDRDPKATITKVAEKVIPYFRNGSCNSNRNNSTNQTSTEAPALPQLWPVGSLTRSVNAAMPRLPIWISRTSQTLVNRKRHRALWWYPRKVREFFYPRSSRLGYKVQSH